MPITWTPVPASAFAIRSTKGNSSWQVGHSVLKKARTAPFPSRRPFRAKVFFPSSEGRVKSGARFPFSRAVMMVEVGCPLLVPRSVPRKGPLRALGASTRRSSEPMILPVKVPEPRDVRATVDRVVDLTADVREVRLRLVEPSRIEYRPGQYADFRIRNSRGEVEVRGYSIASEPGEEGLLFAAKMLPHGLAGAYFRGLAVGSEVSLRAPLGGFALSEDGGLSRLFVGTG